MTELKLSNLHKIILPAFLFLLIPVFAHAEWYWLTIPEDSTIGEFTELSAVEYAVTSIPKDQLQILPSTLMQTLSSTTNSTKCSNSYNSAIQELRDFDSTHKLYTTIYYSKGPEGTQTVFDQGTADARTNLLTSIEKSAKRCLTQEQEAIEEQVRKEAEKERLSEIDIALAVCDIDFFEKEMTNDERMDTWTEREACKNKNIKTVVVEKVNEQIVQPVSLPEVTPEPVDVAVATPIFTSNPLPVKADRENIMTEEVKLSTGATTTTKNTEDIVKEEKPQQIDEVQIEQKIEKPSFFKKVANFFSKLFAWN